MTAAIAPFRIDTTGSWPITTRDTLDFLFGRGSRAATGIVSTIPERLERSEMVIDCLGGTIELTWTGSKPTWLAPVESAIAQFVTLEDNWDGYNGVATTYEAAIEGLRILSEIMHPEDPPPSVVPGGDGSVQFEWHTARADLQFAVNATGAATAFFARADGSYEIELDEESFDTEVLDAFLQDI